MNKKLLLLCLSLLYISRASAEIYIMGELPSLSYSKPVYRIGGLSYARRGGPGFKVTNDKGLEFSISGLVKHEAFWDTRQVNSNRAGDYINFPFDKLIAANGQDINQTGSFNMLAIQTTLNLDVVGLKLGAATLSGNVSADFRGVNDCLIQAMRNINAYITLEWKNMYFKFGQGWIPSFVPDCFPETVSYGMPFEMFGNVGQIKFVYDFGNHLELVAAICGEINEYTSAGPFEQGVEIIPGAVNTPCILPTLPGYQVAPTIIEVPYGQNIFGSTFFRNNISPVAHIQLRKLINEKHLINAGIIVRSIRPRLYGSTDSKGIVKFAVDERITSVSAFILAKYILGTTVMKAKFIYAENQPADGLIGGYGIKSINPINDQREYTNIRSIDVWGEIFTGDKVQPGIFFGAYKNLGAVHSLVNIEEFPNLFGSINQVIYGFGNDINWYFVFAPRCRWNVTDYFSIAGEVPLYYTTFGTINQGAEVCNTHAVNDVRVMLAGYYYF